MNVSNYSDYVCICIPARYQSARLPGKLMLTVDGEPLIIRTLRKVTQVTMVKNVYVLADDEKIVQSVKAFVDSNRDLSISVETVQTDQNCCNGTERIAKSLSSIPDRFTTIVNVQADEIDVDPENIAELIKKHSDANRNCSCSTNGLVSLLHYKMSDPSEIHSPASVKVVKDMFGHALYYSRSVIPAEKNQNEVSKTHYYGFAGLYTFSRHALLHSLTFSVGCVQKAEDIEQLVWLENGFKIHTYDAVAPVCMSVNLPSDYHKLFVREKPHSQSSMPIIKRLLQTYSQWTMCVLNSHRDSESRLMSLKDIHKNSPGALIVSCGPSAKEFQHRIPDFVARGFIIICVKQAFDLPGVNGFCDYHVNNFCNEKHYNWDVDMPPISLYTQRPNLSNRKDNGWKNRYQIIFDVDINRDSIPEGILSQFDNMTFEKNSMGGANLSHSQGDIVYELALPLCQLTGVKHVFTTGWDFSYDRPNNTKATRILQDEAQIESSKHLSQFLHEKFNMTVHKLASSKSLIGTPSCTVEQALACEF